jgi:uncharacterized protein (TIGR00645 family)
MKTIELLLERCILLSRWLLVPLYLALIAILILFAIKAYQEVIHLFAIIATITETDLVLAALALVDLALVANLLVMVVLSSYETFVSNIDVYEGQEKPSWLGQDRRGDHQDQAGGRHRRHFVHSSTQGVHDHPTP